MEENKALLKIEGIHTYLGKSHILHGVSLEMERGEIIALLGRNGVGKSTTMKSIVGLNPPQIGSILYEGNKINGLRPYRICRLGIGYVPEERRIFSNLTVRQNLLMGINSNKGINPFWTMEKLYGYFPTLEKREHQKGRNLSGGEQQLLAIARTMMGNPSLLLLDEPTEGLAPILVEVIIDMIRKIHKNGCSILLVEHAIDVALDLSHRVYIMSKGKVVYRCKGEEISTDEEIRKKYLEI